MVLNVQVRIRVRAERDALDEESFRSILDYEGQGFKLDLNARQVEYAIFKLRKFLELNCSLPCVY